jgi:ADP-ribose pyrophosphatase
MAYQLIKRDYKHRGKVVDLSISRYESATKGEVDIEIVHHNGGAGALALFEDGSVALVRQWRYPAGRYSLEIAASRAGTGRNRPPRENWKKSLAIAPGIWTSWRSFTLRQVTAKRKYMFILRQALKPAGKI